MSFNFPSVPTKRKLTVVLLAALPLLIVGCSMELINARPARELHPPPVAVNLYAGWRVFQAKCSNCHGESAKGSDKAPNLLPIVRTMSSRHFAEMVLKRYDLGNGLGNGSVQGSEKKSTTDSYIDDILNRKEPPIAMPAWQGEPTVNAHILDLYAYLTARAEGKFSKERPVQ
jgi:hypothetical protein